MKLLLIISGLAELAEGLDGLGGVEEDGFGGGGAGFCDGFCYFGDCGVIGGLGVSFDEEVNCTPKVGQLYIDFAI